jgi:hypothetical protein
MHRLLAITLFFISAHTYAAEYYGWAGSCDDIVYEFNFANGKYTAFGNSRYIQNGEEINNYFIDSDRITQDENGTYYLHTQHGSPMSLDLENKDKRIWGKGEYGNQLFNKCSTEDALKVIKHVKENVSPSISAQDKNQIMIFVDDFKKAVERKDLTSVNSMNSWKNIPEELQVILEKQFLDIVEKGILNTNLEYIENGEKLKFGKGEKIFAPNISPIAQISIEIPTDKEFGGGYSFYIGKENSELQFSHVVRQ